MSAAATTDRPAERTPRVVPGDEIGDGVLGVELSLLVLAVGTAASFNRLFLGWDFLSRLAPSLVLAWAISAALRRLRVPAGAALAVHLVTGVVALTVQFAPGTHVAGLPTFHTLEVLGAAIEQSFADFSELVAPVPSTDGFLVVIAACLWVFAFFSDTAAVRYRGTAQAVIPHVAVFGSVAILARSSGRAAATLMFGGALVLYAVAVQSRAARSRRWVTGHRRRGTTALVAATALVSLGALVAGAAIAPIAVGDRDPVVDLRRVGRGAGPRTVVSPFVSIGSLLGPRSDDVVFRVEADAPAYWRLTSLEEFDESRQIWVSSGTYSPARNDLADAGPDAGRPLSQTYEVTGLGGLWLPGAFTPTRIDSDHAVSFDHSSASIILRDDVEGPVRYRLESWIADVEQARRNARPSDRAPADPVHLEVPELSGEVRDAITEATVGARTDFERMIALQDWFRTRFAYDEAVDYSAETDALAAFLEQRRGFCQQFSSAFALMARALGLPSRVAVGFTPGDPEPVDGGATQYVVRGRHAHAWPEVHLAGIGWVPFEPTPQRGDPQSSRHTGVAPAQAEAPATSMSTTSTTAPDDPASAAGSSVPGTATTTAADRSPTDRRVGDTGDAIDGGWLLLVVVALGGGVGVLALVRRGRREVAHSTPERAAVAGAWRRALDALARRGVRPSPSETPLELAERVARIVTSTQSRVGGSDAGGADAGGADAGLDRTATGADDVGTRAARQELVDAMATLARLETEARYGPERRGSEWSAAAAAAAEQVRASIGVVPQQRGQSSSERRMRSRARVPAPLK